MLSWSTAAAVLSFASAVLACPTPAQLGDISILAADDLLISNSTTTSAALLLGKAQPLLGAQAACSDLGEKLWSPHLEDFTAGLNNSLNYEVYAGRVTKDQLFWIAQAGRIPTCRPSLAQCQAMSVDGTVYKMDCSTNLPALCTQTAPASNISFADTAAPFQIQQAVGSASYIGYRDFLTFRFLGIRFAAEPARFTYTTEVYPATGVAEALHPAPQCLQIGNNPNPLPTFNNLSDSTDCLFLNVFTTKLPAAPVPAAEELKPVFVYIYGGGFATGSASNPTNDGGHLAARGDIVTVDLAYRVSSLGFLALDDGIHTGSYWLSDVITGLEWVKANIASFGGDPARVTVFGESAGGEAVMALLASPKAAGLFRAALLQSNNFLQPYIPVETSYNTTTVKILNETGCLSSADQLACLTAYNATELLNLTTISNTPTQDGVYLTTPHLNLNGSDCTNPTNSVPLLISFLRDEGGILDAIYPTTDLDTGLTHAVAPNTTLAASVIASGAFPLGSDPFIPYDNITLEIYNTTTRIATDTFDRCSSQLAAYAGVSNGLFPSIYVVEWNRSYQDPGYNSNNVCLPLPVPGYPYGNPTQDEYMKCHAGDLSFNFGNVARVGFPERDENDTPFAQLVVDYWSAFARSGGDPNPDMGYLQARGYWSTINQIQTSGPWTSVDAEQGAQPMLLEMMWNSYMRPFAEEEQCAILNQPLDYWVE